MSTRSRKERRASAPVNASRLPQLRLPSLPTDKRKRQQVLDEFLGRVRVAKGRKYYYTLHEWWHTPLPKVSDEDKGSHVTSSVLATVMPTHFQVSHHQDMIDKGYASAARRRLPRKSTLARTIHLPQLLRYLIVEKGHGIKEVSSLVPSWKTRYAQYVRTGSFEATYEGLDGEQDAEGPQQDDEVEDSEPQQAGLNTEVATEEPVPSVEEILDDEVDDSQFNEVSVPGSQTRNDYGLTNSALGAMLGSERSEEVTCSLRDDIFRTPESARRVTELELSKEKFLRELKSTSASQGIFVTAQSQTQLASCLAELCDGSFSNFEFIYRSWGDKKSERNMRLRQILERSGLGTKADLLVAVVSTWINRSNSSASRANMSGRNHVANITHPICNNTDPCPVEPTENSAASLPSNTRNVAHDSSEDGSEDRILESRTKKKRRFNTNNVRSLLLVLFYTRKLGLAENESDEERSGIKRKYCSGYTLEDLCERNVLPLSRSMVFAYRSTGELLLKAGKEKSIRKFEKRELLRILLSTHAENEVLKHADIGGNNREGSILQKVLAAFDLDKNLLDEYM